MARPTRARTRSSPADTRATGAVAGCTLVSEVGVLTTVSWARCAERGAGTVQAPGRSGAVGLPAI